MKFYYLGGKSFETDFKNHMLYLQNTMGYSKKKIIIQGREGRKVFIVLCTLRKLANSPNPPGKKPLPPKISLWPGVICFFKVMMKLSTVFNSDCLEILWSNPCKNRIYGLTHWNSIIPWQTWNFTPTLLYGYKME